MRFASFLQYIASKGYRREDVINEYNYLKLNSFKPMNDSRYKSLTKEKLEKAGFRVPKGRLITDIKEIYSLISLGKLNFPLVVKPDASSKGHFVFADIKTMSELEEAFKTVELRYKKALVEEYVEGDDYRFFVLDGKVLAIARRSPPYIVGDGKRSVSELLDKVCIDDEVKLYLKQEKLNLTSVVARDRKVMIRKNANRSTGGIAENVTDVIPIGFKKIAVEASKILGLRLVGMDMIIKDLTDFNSYSILEANSSPGFGIHESPDMGEKMFLKESVLKAIVGATKNPAVKRG